MFDSSEPFAFFDYFRVPYEVVIPARPAWGTLRAGGRELAWPTAGGRLGKYRLGEITFYAHVHAGDALRSDWGTGWQPIHDVTAADGTRVAAIWRDETGNLLLPFDPGEIMQRLWSEQYQERGMRLRVQKAAVHAYYAVRPALPRSLQLAMRRVFTKVQQTAPFPAYPAENSLHDLYDLLFRLLTELAGEHVPYLHAWPGGHDWALVLTHDVETADGIPLIEGLRAIEREVGHESSWNFVPQRYETDDAVVGKLKADGCEVGVHGLLHDGRDLASLRLLRKRLPGMRAAADRWGASGFRSPATQRNWNWMPLLRFAYDSSYHDTAPYEPRPGGSCSYLPYFIGNPGRPGDMVELPMTLPMDHTLFEILQRPDATEWLAKAARVRERGGMVLVLTHPDYTVDPRVAEGYRALLTVYRDDPGVWRALPRDVAAWWQRRAVSTLERTPDGWVVRGPAAGEGSVRTLDAGAAF